MDPSVTEDHCPIYIRAMQKAHGPDSEFVNGVGGGGPGLQRRG